MLGAITFVMSLLVQPALGAEPPPGAIADKMAGVTDQLNRNETGKPVQTEQKAIVRDLDELIAALEKKYEENNGGISSANPRRGLRDSIIVRGPGGMGTLVDPKDTDGNWGQLSSPERDRILQSMSEGFPPEYRTVLERYYRRLADEKGGAAAKAKAAAAAPTDKAKAAAAPAEAAKKP
jgi:hypothetical protein